MTSSRPSTKYHEIPRDAAEAHGVPLQMQHSAANFVRWLLRIMVRDGTQWMALQPTPLHSHLHIHPIAESSWLLSSSSSSSSLFHHLSSLLFAHDFLVCF